MDHAQPAAAALVEMAAGAWVSQAIYVIVKLGIADCLAQGPRSAPELAAQVGAHPQRLYRLLRTLASLSLFEEHPDGTFTLTERGAPLRADAPDTVRHLIMMLNEEQYQAWSAFLHSVRTGESAFHHVFGKTVYEYYRENPEPAATFQRAMADVYRREGPALAEMYDFSNVRTVLDVGGGDGQVLAAVLSRHVHLSGILLDLKFGIAEARRTAPNPLSRCELVTGDFFISVPRGADLIMLKHVIHNWHDEQATTILENCRAALPSGGKVLVMESLIGPPNQRSFVTLLDLQMMAMPGGLERTEAEYIDLFARAGLRHTQTLFALPSLAVLEAVTA